MNRYFVTGAVLDLVLHDRRVVVVAGSRRETREAMRLAEDALHQLGVPVKVHRANGVECIRPMSGSGSISFRSGSPWGRESLRGMTADVVAFDHAPSAEVLEHARLVAMPGGEVIRP